jgi:hypothetical protein
MAVMAFDVDSQLPTLTGSRQTKLPWSRVIASYDAIPESFRSSYKMIVGDQPLVPYTVFTPAIAGMRYKTTEKLLCEVNDAIYIWERIGKQVRMTEYPLKRISDFEIGYVLLFSWFTINGVTEAGILSSSTVEFNTVTGFYFDYFVNRLRPATAQIAACEQSEERAKFDNLAVENFKFMNFALESLSGSEKVLHIVWQPKISKPMLMLGWYKSYRALTLSHLTILTNKELIVIQDDERSGENRGSRYGGKWHYIALSHIKAISLVDHTDDLLILSLTLSPGERQVEIIFSASKKEKITELQDQLKKLIGYRLSQK